MGKRILLGHLNSNGDCLFATVIARQIKEVDYPGCHLTWAVSSRCRQSVELNPYVDEIWEIPTSSALANEDEWSAFVAAVEEKKANGEFDRVFLTQIFGDMWLNFDGGIRSSTYNNYPHPITVSMQPTIRLSDDEVDNVTRFAGEHQLADREHVILVECGPDSFDSALNPISALKFAQRISSEFENTAIILSSNKKIETPSANIIDGSVLTFRENAELTKYCDLFVGCASGISWLTTTDWAKKLNMVLVIDPKTRPFPSMIYDHEFIGLHTDHIIEFGGSPKTADVLTACVRKVFDSSFASAKKKFNEKLVVTDYFFVEGQLRKTLLGYRPGKALSCLRAIVKRNGVRSLASPDLVRIVLEVPSKALRRLLKRSGPEEGSELTPQIKQ
jgi:ADP-heptose:LPS heptosyltransferase